MLRMQVIKWICAEKLRYVPRFSRIRESYTARSAISCDGSLTDCVLLTVVRCSSNVQSKMNSKDESATEMTVESSVTDICNHINSRLNRVFSIDAYVSENERRNIVQLLLASKVPADSIKRILTDQPFLLKHASTTWADTISFLKSHCFQPGHLLPLVSGSPALLHGSARKTLLDVLSILRHVGISEGKRQMIVVGNSGLLLNDDVRTIQRRHASLLSVFTKAELQRLMIATPCVLTDTWTETRRKIEYMYGTMGIRSREMTNSRVFSHTFLHLVARHRFAERAGIYHMPNKHEIAAREEDRPLPTEIRNPTLKELVDTSDAAFVRIIGDLTVDEYHAFVAMMSVELEEQVSDAELGSDSDGEVSDEDDVQ